MGVVGDRIEIADTILEVSLYIRYIIKFNTEKKKKIVYLQSSYSISLFTLSSLTAFKYGIYFISPLLLLLNYNLAQSAGAAEYTDSISAEG